MHALPETSTDLRRWFVGDIVGTVARKPPREREWLSARRWHVVAAWTGREAEVARTIGQDGMAAYVPQIKRRVRVSARAHREVAVSLYPGYLFAGFDPAGELWPKIASIDGIIKLFMCDGHPIAIPEEAIWRIRQVESEERNGRREQPTPMPVRLGDIVRIVDCHSFSGLFGVVKEIDESARRVRVDLEIMRRSVPLWLDGGQFEAV